MDEMLDLILESWGKHEGIIHANKALLAWIEEKNRSLDVKIDKIGLEDCHPWHYDAHEGCIQNQDGSFFRIGGIRQIGREGVQLQQPIIIQDEIGLLGIICKKIDGILHFLMQAKIEPGNLNKIQISPTIQATKSNFTQKHGGKKPPYLEYFTGETHVTVVFDQIQSEQSSRFFKKRNRNMLVFVDDEVAVLPSHAWMTLGQIKAFMKIDNLVNMDTRTVLSNIPFSLFRVPNGALETLKCRFRNQALLRSMFRGQAENMIPAIYQEINHYKMFSETRSELISLRALDNWDYRDCEIVCREAYPFKVIFCNILIEGREVREWRQPLFEAQGVSTFGLFQCNRGGHLHFLVRVCPEVGCLDGTELGPTIQYDPVKPVKPFDRIEVLFEKKLRTKRDVVFDQLLSEEGGRFYHEQNRNLIIEVEEDEVGALPSGYIWADYFTLNMMQQINNTLNIQLRNLLSVLEK